MRVICQKPVHFLSTQIVVWASFFKCSYYVLGMYNFDIDLKKTNEKTSWKCIWCRSRWIATFVSTRLRNFPNSLINFIDNGQHGQRTHCSKVGVLYFDTNKFLLWHIKCIISIKIMALFWNLSFYKKIGPHSCQFPQVRITSTYSN